MELDLLIRGGTVVDGSGWPGRLADVGVRGERIVAVDNASSAASGKSCSGQALATATAAQVLDARGLIVAPGFVDIHTHSDFSLLLDPYGESKVRQGVTTEVIGNCSYTAYPARPEDVPALMITMSGISADDLDWDWTDLEGYRRRFNTRGAALNVAPLAGHCALRVAAMGYANRPPTSDELATMERLLADTMQQGAFGFSAGLTLAPSAYGTIDEIVALCEVAARYGGFYAAHMRVHADRQMEGRQETLEIARRGRIAVQMAHNNVMGRPFWHLVPEMLALLDRERAAGVDVTYDVYPYLAGMSIVDQLMPAWAQEGGVEALVARLRDRATRQRIYDELKPGRAGGALPWDWGAIRVTDVQPAQDKPFEGKTVAEVAALLGVDGLEALLTLVERDRASATYHHLSEVNTKLLLQHPLGMVGSDGNAVTVSTRSLRGKPHPRFFGTFPRVLGRYVRDEGVLSLEEAIRKMTSAPAARVGLRERGLLAPGNIADITLFDPLTIVDRATYDEPSRYAEGVDSVVVSGQIVLRRGQMTGALPGRALAR
jgi:N-acyl-D-amino-acid deacylase